MGLQERITALAQAIGEDIKAMQAAQSPLGSIHTGLQKPAGQWLECGVSYPSADYPALYAALGRVAPGAWAPVYHALPASAAWCSIAYGNGVFVAVAAGSNIAATSPDGANWTLRTLPTSGDWVAVVFGRGFFAAAAKGTDVVVTSPDGVNWIQEVLPVSADWEVGAFAQGVTTGRPTTLPVHVFASGAADCVVSHNGVWAKSATPLPAPLARWGALAAFGAGINVALPYSGDIALTSTHASSTWTPRTLPQSAEWRSVTYGNGVFVAVAAGSNIAATSPNGIDWTPRTLPASDNWSGVLYAEGVFLAFAGGSSASGVAATSPDGITWALRALPFPANWRAVAYGDGRFVLVAGGAGASNANAVVIPVATPTFLVPPAAGVASPYKQWVKA